MNNHPFPQKKSKIEALKDLVVKAVKTALEWKSYYDGLSCINSLLHHSYPHTIPIIFP